MHLSDFQIVGGERGEAGSVVNLVFEVVTSARQLAEGGHLLERLRADELELCIEDRGLEVGPI